MSTSSSIFEKDSVVTLSNQQYIHVSIPSYTQNIAVSTWLQL
jgi:hypothetical protein